MPGSSFNLSGLPQAFFAAIANKLLNSTTPTSALATGMGSKVIPANTITPGTLIRVWGAGVYSLGLLGGTATIQVKVNGTTVASITTSSLLNSASSKPFEFIVRLMARDQNLAIASGNASYSTGLGARVVDNIDDPIGTFALDQTIDNTVEVMVSWDAPATGKSVTVTQATIQVSNRG